MSLGWKGPTQQVPALQLAGTEPRGNSKLPGSPILRAEGAWDSAGLACTWALSNGTGKGPQSPWAEPAGPPSWYDLVAQGPEDGLPIVESNTVCYTTDPAKDTPPAPQLGAELGLGVPLLRSA